MKLNELYRSVQGEGPRVGIPTTFVRFGGCNLKCPGWPCDTPHAIFPKEYRHEWETIDPYDLSERIVERSAPRENICFTGGEPFLQPNDELRELSNILYVSDRRLECFSNGTLLIPAWAFETINFVFDWKLPGSGETSFNAEVFLTNLHRARMTFASNKMGHALKFTVASWDDFQTAVDRWAEFVPENTIPVYVGVVWGKVEPSELVTWMLDADLVGWHLNLQTHKYIWHPTARRT